MIINRRHNYYILGLTAPSWQVVDGQWKIVRYELARFLLRLGWTCTVIVLSFHTNTRLTCGEDGQFATVTQTHRGKKGDSGPDDLTLRTGLTGVHYILTLSCDRSLLIRANIAPELHYRSSVYPSQLVQDIRLYFCFKTSHKSYQRP